MSSPGDSATARVLLAVSGSSASRHATAIAADLASKFDAELTILHVVPPTEYRVGRLAPTLPITRQLDDPLVNAVLLDARRVAWTGGTNAKTMLIAGDTAHVIVSVAANLEADLLVIGSKRRPVPTMIAAKTRWWVHAHAPCPVLPITTDRPPGPHQQTRPILAK